MKKKSDEISFETARRLADSPAGKQLSAYLSKNGGKQLEKAMGENSGNDYQTVSKLLQTLMDDPQARKLLAELEDACHG